MEPARPGCLAAGDAPWTKFGYSTCRASGAPGTGSILSRLKSQSETEEFCLLAVAKKPSEGQVYRAQHLGLQESEVGRLVFGWFDPESREQRRKVRLDRRHLAARSRRFLRNYLNADDTLKPEAHRRICDRCLRYRWSRIPTGRRAVLFR
jgi:hypothetical protein